MPYYPSHYFLDYSVLHCVVHNGTCWAACISNSLGLGGNGIVQVAELTMAMADDSLLPPVVLDWIALFKLEFEKFLVAPPAKKYLPSSAYVTTPVLQAYANKYGIGFIMTNVSQDRSRGSRRSVNIIDVITPSENFEVFTSVILRVEGEKFDYYTAREGYERGYNAFIEHALEVSSAITIPS